MSLTRHEFEEGIQQWLEQDGRAATSAWTVKEQPYTSHKYLQSLGRPVLLQPDKQSQLEGVDPLPGIEEADEATAASIASTTHMVTGSVDIYVVWSLVYQVPALLCRGYDSGGSPLPLNDLVRSTLFRTRPDEYPLSTLDETTQKGRDTGDDQAHLPAITQMEHSNVPGLMCYSLHPCETAATLAEILLPNESNPHATDVPHSPLKILQAWFMLVSTIVAIR